MHGSGVEHPLGSLEVQTTKTGSIVKDYWEKIWDILEPECELFFTRTNTITRPFNDAGIRTEYCKAINDINPDVVFTHSFGNMVVAAGAHLGDIGCDKIGKAADQIHWYGSQGPMGGTPAADKLAAECAAGTLLAEFMKKECDGTTKTLRGAYDSLRMAFDASVGLPAGKTVQSGLPCSVPDCKTLKDIGLDKMSGEMCGQTPYGPIGPTTAGLVAASLKVGSAWGPDETRMYPSIGNDGFVALSNCRVAPPATFGVTPADPFFIMQGNHKMGTCSYNDEKAPSKQPCAWYLQMVLKTKAAKGGGGGAAGAATDEDEKKRAAAEAEAQAENQSKEPPAEENQSKMPPPEENQSKMPPPEENQSTVEEPPKLLQVREHTQQARKSYLVKKLRGN
jgi:hypothetical protein